MLLRPDIEALLDGPHKLVPNEAVFRLLVAVHQLDNLAIQWCGGKIGQQTPSTPPPLPSTSPTHNSSHALARSLRLLQLLLLVAALCIIHSCLHLQHRQSKHLLLGISPEKHEALCTITLPLCPHSFHQAQWHFASPSGEAL